MAGAADEAFFSLKRGDRWTWGLFADIDEAVTMVVDQERGLETAVDSSRDRFGQQKLRIEVFFAESDMMIGKKGQEWFDQSWRTQDANDVITYTTETVPQSSHETIGGPEHGIFAKLFEEISLSFS